MQLLVLSYFFITSIVVMFMSNLSSRKQDLLYVIIGIGLILLAGFRLGDAVRDYHIYIDMYENVRAGRFVLTDVSFKWIAMLSGSSLMLFVIYAILGISAKLYAIRKIGTTMGLSLLIYISNFFILHEMTQIRAGVAAGILLLSVKYIYDRNLWKFSLCVIVATLFHASSLIMIPLWFINPKRKYIYILSLLPLIGFVFAILKISVFTVIPIPLVQEKLERYQMLTEMGVGEFASINIFNLVFLAKLAIYYLVLLRYDMIVQYNKYFHILMFIWSISICSFWVFSAIPVLSFRISELYGIVEIITIPLLVYVMKPRILCVSFIGSIAVINFMINVYFNSLIS